MRGVTPLVSLLLVSATAAGDKPSDRPWRTLPLITNGRIDPNWVQIGWGGFAIDGGSLRTECDKKGMGLLLYRPEKFGNCQVRVVFKSRDAKSNGGVFVRIDDGVLGRVGEKSPPVRRDQNGKLSKEMLDKIREASEKELGAWYRVHHDYEVQICDKSDEYHRTGAVYSLAKALPAPSSSTDWRTMIVSLDGNRILVDIDGRRVTTFDPDGPDVPQARKWPEPRREPKRPQTGYIGLQNHDPGDVVYYKEVSIRPLGRTP